MLESLSSPLILRGLLILVVGARPGLAGDHRRDPARLPLVASKVMVGNLSTSKKSAVRKWASRLLSRVRSMPHR
jgi:hypothetical protein